MRKLMRSMAALLLVIALWLALVLSEWLPRPTADEQAALAALAAAPSSAKGERDGFAATWFMSYDVPESQFESMLREEIAVWEQRHKKTGSNSKLPSAEGKFAPVASPSNQDPALCENWKGDCLNRVRANPEATRQRLAEYATRLQRSRAFAKYDHFKYPFEPSYDAPVSPIGGIINLQLAEVALQYTDGNVDQAFATLCADTKSWRRLRSHSDILINDMVGVAQMGNATQLYAHMLAEQSLDYSAPCPDVFAPLTDAELNQCTVMRFEFLSLQNTLDDGLDFYFSNKGWGLVPKLVNSQHIARREAKTVGHFCMAKHQQAIAQRDPTRPTKAAACTLIGKVFDPIGCVMLSNITPNLHDYYLRVLDLDARLRLLGLAIHLRGLTGEQLQQEFAQRSGLLDSPANNFELLSGTLRMRNHEKGRSEYWELPLLTPVAYQAE